MARIEPASLGGVKFLCFPGCEETGNGSLQSVTRGRGFDPFDEGAVLSQISSDLILVIVNEVVMLKIFWGHNNTSCTH